MEDLDRQLVEGASAAAGAGRQAQMGSAERERNSTQVPMPQQMNGETLQLMNSGGRLEAERHIKEPVPAPPPPSTAVGITATPTESSEESSSPETESSEGPSPTKKMEQIMSSNEDEFDFSAFRTPGGKDAFGSPPTAQKAAAPGRQEASSASGEDVAAESLPAQLLDEMRQLKEEIREKMEQNQHKEAMVLEKALNTREKEWSNAMASAASERMALEETLGRQQGEIGENRDHIQALEAENEKQLGGDTTATAREKALEASMRNVTPKEATAEERDQISGDVKALGDRLARVRRNMTEGARGGQQPLDIEGEGAAAPVQESPLAVKVVYKSYGQAPEPESGLLSFLPNLHVEYEDAAGSP